MKTDQEKRRVLDRLVAHYGRQDWWSSENFIQDWVSMILIQQTTSANADRALTNLAGKFDAQTLLNMPMEELQELIRPAGFFKSKSQYIKNIMAFYLEHGGDLAAFENVATEDLRKQLLAIKGIGEETADASLLYVFKRKVFIADQYALRLFNRLGFGPYKTYRELRQDFMPLVEEKDVDLKLCQEWHAVIDVHGKHFRSQKEMDESWLMVD
ncbi:endonuclease III domain-containing protein [Enterococcus sp. HY326]|uniref:endonuclease III domain-containing protein n=1 Tax=Enterococcus sp. HY326 TaxID=2971265 RepID=UPI00223F4903|nr:endonuclease III domain-containing protein [Enterococcus sp. HY326]